MIRSALCEWCGEPFKSRQPSARYCSIPCKEHAWKKRRGLRNASQRAAAGKPDYQPGDVEPVKLPTLPTPAEPGSNAKAFVFQERIRRRQTLHHPDDCTMDTLSETVAAFSYAKPFFATRAMHIDTVQRYLERRERRIARESHG